MIKRFQFRLKQVLRHRANVMEMKERALAEVEGQLILEQQVLVNLLSLRGEVLAEVAQLQLGPFEGMERELYQRYLDWIAGEREREKRIIGDLETIRDAKRAELVAASQEHRIVERLREHRHQDYLGGVARLEQNDLDEIAGNAFVRNESAAGAAPRTWLAPSFKASAPRENS